MYNYGKYEKDSPRIKVSKLSEKMECNIQDLLNYFRSDGIFVKDKNDTVSTIEASIIMHYVSNKELKKYNYEEILKECEVN